MNAVTRIAAPVSAQDLWSPEERAHRHAISIHCPNENDFAMGCRAHIAAIRDQASAGLRRCSADAYGILSEVARISAVAVYAPASAKRLVMLRSALTQAMEAARALERVAARGDAA